MPNVIPDPGFEQGKGDWWSSRGDGTNFAVTHDTTTAHTGTASIKITCLTPDTLNGMQPYLPTEWPASGYETWQSYAWVRHAAAGTKSFQPMVSYRDAGGTWVNDTAPPVDVPANTWTRVGKTTTLPSGATAVRGYLFYGFGGAPCAKDDAFFTDDVFLGRQNLKLAVTSRAAATGYGTFRATVTTDPPTSGVAVQFKATDDSTFNLTTGADGTVTQDFTAGNAGTAGEHVSSVTATGWVGDYESWTLRPLEFSRFELVGQELTVEALWIRKNGIVTRDAIIEWGDDKSVLVDTEAPYWETGAATVRHTYPLTPFNRHYNVKLTSADSVTKQIIVPGTGRAVLSSLDGTYEAVCDVQAWPQTDHERRYSRLELMGRPTPVIVYDLMQDARCWITLLTRTKDEQRNMWFALQYGGLMRLDAPCPEVDDIVFVAAKYREVRLSARNGADVRRLWEIDAMETSDPIGAKGKTP